MEVLISDKLKRYASDKELKIMIRKLTINSCCIGKTIKQGRTETPPQVLTGEPKKDYKKDYTKLKEAGIIIHIHKTVIKNCEKIELDLSGFLCFKKVSIKNLVLKS